MAADGAKIRLDKWLWHARFFKTRTLAAKEVSAGHVRVNGTRVAKPAHSVAPEDVLTFPQARAVRVVRVLAIGTRRGPAPEAQALYDDLSPPVSEETVPAAPKYEGKGRPTKRDRRKLDLNGPGTLE
ncbi:RNA-binding S4 domain-containing protein [uncultured Roseovarius sp.]|uniref:RNA-binding S4 domain-containing protein n=1 Tax=Roseovarius sp. TaxID=1486281 RepID=UPI0025D3F076|nr:RNA-binding S4 domain-containing protein [uncultured Roseovarius sp.]